MEQFGRYRCEHSTNSFFSSFFFRRSSESVVDSIPQPGRFLSLFPGNVCFIAYRLKEMSRRYLDYSSKAVASPDLRGKLRFEFYFDFEFKLCPLLLGNINTLVLKQVAPSMLAIKCRRVRLQHESTLPTPLQTLIFNLIFNIHCSKLHQFTEEEHLDPPNDFSRGRAYFHNLYSLRAAHL
jgi:hypothetical protein